MADKAIGGLTEASAIGVNDFMVIETAAGNTRKVRRGAVSLGQHAAPSMLQKGTLRNDGTIALPGAPTVGNLMVHVQGGYKTYPAYTPAGFVNVAIYQSNANNFVVASIRRVQSGDTGSYAVSATDNQFCALYEYQDANTVLGLTGGPMPVSGSTINLGVPLSPFGPTDEVIVVIENDLVVVPTITPKTGLTKDYEASADGSNHHGGIYRVTSAFDQILAGSWSGTPAGPVYGAFAVVGKFV